MRLYLAGPMTGIEDKNYPRFMRAAAELREQGHFVGNPAEMNHQDVSYRQALAVDLAWILAIAEGIALLPGWETSKGCAVEYALATAIGIPAYHVVFGNPMANAGIKLYPVVVK